MKRIDKNNTEMIFNNQLWTISEASTYLNLTVGTIYNLVYQKAIPFHKKRKRLYFIPREIHNWILEGN